MRIAVLDKEKCTRKKCGYQCLKVCPGVKMGEDTITVGEDEYPVINEELCTGCGLCVKKCPVDAIRIVNLPAGTGKPTFQYGVNSFRLFGFVLPKPKSVVGVIGVNGIGKTTALQLLRGTIKPNFGRFGEKLDWNEIKKEVRGLEIQNYLQSVEDNEAKISFKMQYVDELIKGKGTVRELVDECNERGLGNEFIKDFSLEKLLDKQFTELSGGELQRAAIACAFSKDASVYFFDEPSSFLDVKQRLLVAKKIRELAKEKSVVVVEHDLALLDYLSDYVHVFYGARGVFGRVSNLKSTRIGINEFLDGYLKDENVLFRDYAIKFQDTAGGDYKAAPVFRYPELTKKFTGFELTVDAGDVLEKETLAILGANATGKTTFVKMLAGVLEPDNGAALERKTVAFKPQYLKSDFQGTVRDLFNEAKGFDYSFFDAEVKNKLDVAPLMDKNVQHLSGGELQRVSIALSLCTPCELRLLDEPSAFLDVEHRLFAADAIRKATEVSETPCFVVDHDVLFADTVSNRILLFEGEPGVKGKAQAPQHKREGMHAFLKEMGISMRRDEQSKRPRINKTNSQKDCEQKKSGNYYYS
ncbi:MAG: ribosome biogenesis/translation initiation ATPase RLI [Candidatus Micrarchaeota archaeon]